MSLQVLKRDRLRGNRQMHPAITTSNIWHALLRGAVVAAGVLCSFLLADLPLDWKIGPILFVTCTISMTIAFYDSNRTRTTTKVLMQNIQWDFSSPNAGSIDEFISIATETQSNRSNWIPFKKLNLQGTLQIRIDIFHDDKETVKYIELTPEAEERWTQSSLLFALHRELSGSRFLGDRVFFEGLIPYESGKALLLLGS